MARTVLSHPRDYPASRFSYFYHMKTAPILYVDDEPQNLFSFQAAFRRFFTIRTADSAEKAIEMMEQEQAAVLLCDQRMPGMTGAELLTLARERWPKVIRILVTGYSDMSVVIDAINKGNTYYYVTKPWRLEELKLILENALSKWHLEQEHEALLTEKLMLEKTVLEAEKAAIEARWQALHSKLQPHFLFNALNTIPPLIKSKPEKAVTFTHTLARLLRRLTEQPERAVNSLEDEVAITRDYLELQSIRFEDKIQVKWSLPMHHPAAGLPMLALQLMVENALKHNDMSRERPLQISILYQPHTDSLLVRNCYQPRAEAEEGMGIGLDNIQKRYALLGRRLPAASLSEGWYDITLPLVRYETDPNNHH